MRIRKDNSLPTEQKLWQRELELIAEDNDFLLSLLASLQTEHVITHRHDERTCIFFNHFQYFFQQTRHLKATIEKQEVRTKESYESLKEEINGLIEKFEVFKHNFRAFLDLLTARKQTPGLTLEHGL